MTYHEKSTWVSLISAFVIFGVYFIKAFTVMNNPAVANNTLIIYFIIAVVISIVIQIGSQIIFAVKDRKTVEAGLDERDKSIELKVRERAYYVLVFGIWIAVGTQMFDSQPAIMINVLMLAFVVSEMVAYISKLIIYRRGY